jgi:hypothetical protein
MAFTKGNVANPIGRPKTKLLPFSIKDIGKHFLEWKRLVETGEMSDLQRMHATRGLVEFMCDRLWGKPAQAIAVTADKPLAAVVNITLGSDANGLPTIPLTPLGQALLTDSKPCLVTENNTSRDVEGPEALPAPAKTNDVLDWLG